MRPYPTFRTSASTSVTIASNIFSLCAKKPLFRIDLCCMYCNEQAIIYTFHIMLHKYKYDIIMYSIKCSHNLSFIPIARVLFQYTSMCYFQDFFAVNYLSGFASGIQKEEDMLASIIPSPFTSNFVPHWNEYFLYIAH